MLRAPVALATSTVFRRALQLAKRSVNALERRQPRLVLPLRFVVHHVRARFGRQWLISDADYRRWVTQVEKPRNLGAPTKLVAQPRISVVMPVYNVEERWLARAIESVMEQSYANWELCIANDASTRPGIAPLLDDFARRDERIKVIHRSKNGHISEASNSAVELATGEFIALLDNDDELPSYALAEVVKAINEHPDAVVLYSDEDKLDEFGQRFEPYFKCDWNYELFLSHNMISHFGVYRTSVIREIGGFRKGYEGSQDYDLALRAVERATPSQVVHIPQVLYHWRAIAGSVALAPGEKSYAHDAARRAIADHLVRTGSAAMVEASPFNASLHRAKFELPSPAPSVAIIIPTRNRVELLRACLQSIEQTTYPSFEVVIVDNDSDDSETLQYFAELERTGRARVVKAPGPFNFSKINNLAVDSVDADIVVFVNNDIEVLTPDWLTELVRHAARPSIGAVGAKLFYPDGTLQHAGVILGIVGPANHAFRHFPGNHSGHCGRAILQQRYSAVTAACMAMRRDVFKAIGGFDEELAVAYNDIDLCLRANAAGYHTVWTPHAQLLHKESASRGEDRDSAKAERLKRERDIVQARWSALIANDPYYSPNLTREREDFGLRWSFKDSEEAIA